MASHVVVIDATARRHNIKTTPQTHLNDVLLEACKKFGVSADQYGLKHKDKLVELSRTIRLSGLSPGARLTLVQISKTPTAVSVALQLPTSVTPTPTRLTDKFPNNISLWQILRRFESGVAGGEATKDKNFNFTQRATPRMADGVTGAGRLCYEMPTFNVLGRQLDTLADLQKTLGQLGISGSAMLRLDFRSTGQPLEEAMAEISSYFQSVEEPSAAPAGASAKGGADISALTTTSADGMKPMDTSPEPTTSAGNTSTEPLAPAAATTTPSEAPATSTTDPKLTVFNPPSQTTPAAAAAATFDENDYVPTADHARSHQALLNRSSKNVKLLGEREIAAQQQAKADALAEVQSVTVRLRFPDQSLVQRVCSKQDTSETLYAVCREVMDRPASEAFSLRATGPGAVSTTLKDIPDRLIQDLGWTGRVLVTVVWGDGVGPEVKSRPSLKSPYRQQAQELRVEVTKAQAEPDAAEGNAGAAGEADDAKAKQKKSAADKETRMRKLLGKMTKS